jgi:hypothetical protein
MTAKGLASLLAAGSALVLAGSAYAKGPSEARIEGPNLDRAIVLRGMGEPGGGSFLASFALQAGFFSAVYDADMPRAMLRGRPRGYLGPRYRVAYVVPTGDTTTARVRQDLYPYARPTAVTFMRPGQPVFPGMKAPGGWFRAPGTLKTMLVAHGLPASPRLAGDGWRSPGRVIVSLMLVLALVTAWVVAARRPRAAPAG